MSADFNLVRLAAGDHPEWERLTRQYRPLLHRHAYSVIRNHDDAEEVVQESLAYLWSRRQKMLSVRGIEPFLVKCVRRRSINRAVRTAAEARRRSLRLATISIEPMTQEDFQPTSDSGDLGKYFDRLERTLTETQRWVFSLLREDPTLSSRQIAQRLTCSHKNVLALLRRIRKAALSLGDPSQNSDSYQPPAKPRSQIRPRVVVKIGVTL